MVSNALGESQCKDFFQPLVASTPVKEPATSIDLDDSDSDVDCIEHHQRDGHYFQMNRVVLTWMAQARPNRRYLRFAALILQ